MLERHPLDQTPLEDGQFGLVGRLDNLQTLRSRRGRRAGRTGHQRRVTGRAVPEGSQIRRRPDTPEHPGAAIGLPVEAIEAIGQVPGRGIGHGLNQRRAVHDRVSQAEVAGPGIVPAHAAPGDPGEEGGEVAR